MERVQRRLFKKMNTNHTAYDIAKNRVLKD